MELKLLNIVKNLQVNSQFFQCNFEYQGSPKIHYVKKKPEPRCLKITEKVSLNIASEASYVYVLSEQKLIKKCQKMVQFGEFLKT